MLAAVEFIGVFMQFGILLPVIMTQCVYMNSENIWDIKCFERSPKGQLPDKLGQGVLPREQQMLACSAKKLVILQTRTNSCVDVSGYCDTTC